ncbi:MAG: hypothetical protein HQL32_06265 [Planctomycetes bacterium]|nr:hypothetical protein [Planctomycetota bacterium]
MNNKILTALCAFFLFFSSGFTAQQIPELLVAALGKGALHIKEGKVLKSYKTPAASQDAWYLKDGSILACGMKGLIKYNQDGKKEFEWKPEGVAKYEIHSCMPLPDNRTLVAVNGTKQLFELNAKGITEKTITIEDLSTKNTHMQMRIVRKCKNGEYVVVASGENKVLICNSDGSTKKTIDMNKLPAGIKSQKVHGLAVLNNGNYLIGTGYGKCLVEMTADGECVWQLSPADVPELGLAYISGIHRLSNGNTVVSAYKSKYNLFEVTPDKKIIWKSNNKDIGKPTNVQVIGEEGDAESFGLQK